MDWHVGQALFSDQYETGDATAREPSYGPLFERPLDGRAIKSRSNDPDLAEEAFFANQNVVCRLRDPATVEFLIQVVGAEAVE